MGWVKIGQISHQEEETEKWNISYYISKQGCHRPQWLQPSNMTWWALRAVRKEKNTYNLAASRLQPLPRWAIPNWAQDVRNTGCWPWVQFSSVAQLCPTLCDPMNRSTPGLPVHHQLLESNQTHVHWVSDAIQPSHPLLSPSSLALNLSQHQGLFKWVSSSHEVAKLLEFQLQHQPFQ